MSVVGIDYWPATTHAPGVGRYVRELTRALARSDDGVELRLLDFGPGARSIGEPLLGLEGREVRRLRIKAPRRLLDVSARLGFGADRWLGGCDLFHGVFPASPPVSRALRTCAVSELPPPSEDARFGAALRRCSAVFTFSRWAADLLRERYELEPGAVHALPVGCEHWRRALGREPPLDDPPRVLALGRIDERRNPLAVLRACETLARDGVDLRLSFVGRAGDAYDALRAHVTRSPISSRVSWDSTPREETLPGLVARSSVLVHLGDGELTPVTGLEALALGCAVVANRTPAYEEALGPAAYWLDASARDVDPAELARALGAALETRHDALQRSARQALAAAYSWRRHSELTLGVWRDLLARRQDRTTHPP